MILKNQTSEVEFLLRPLPQPTSDFRKVKIIGTGLCLHSHSSFWEWSFWYLLDPMVQILKLPTEQVFWPAFPYKNTQLLEYYKLSEVNAKSLKYVK